MPHDYIYIFYVLDLAQFFFFDNHTILFLNVSLSSISFYFSILENPIFLCEDHLI